jgi:hypothetical protein
MTERRSLRLAGTGALAFIVATAICTTSCASKKPQSPGMDLTSMHLSPAPAGSCKIDAVKMCQVTGGLAGAAPSSQPATMPTAGSYAAPNASESVEFQIPMGQTIELKCYYDLQHNSIYRAEATAESALTGNSVEYMKQRGLCINK